MEMDERGTNIYCFLFFISLVVIFFILLNLYSVLVVTPIKMDYVANDILLISVMVTVLIVIFFMYKKSKKNL